MASRNVVRAARGRRGVEDRRPSIPVGCTSRPCLPSSAYFSFLTRATSSRVNASAATYCACPKRVDRRRYLRQRLSPPCYAPAAAHRACELERSGRRACETSATKAMQAITKLTLGSHLFVPAFSDDPIGVDRMNVPAALQAHECKTPMRTEMCGRPHFHRRVVHGLR
jgi:hypothetical protein